MNNAIADNMRRMMAIDPIKDWIIGGRHGTQENYSVGYDRIFGKQDIFKNLAKDDSDECQTANTEDREE